MCVAIHILKVGELAIQRKRSVVDRDRTQEKTPHSSGLTMDGLQCTTLSGQQPLGHLVETPRRRSVMTELPVVSYYHARHAPEARVESVGRLWGLVLLRRERQIDEHARIFVKCRVGRGRAFRTPRLGSETSSRCGGAVGRCEDLDVPD